MINILLQFLHILFILSAIAFSTAKAKAQETEDQLVKYVVNNPVAVKQGEQFQIDVLFTIQPDWYIYAPTGINAADGMIETKVVFKLPDGITKIGKTRLPKTTYKNGHEVYEGSNILMSQTLTTATSIRPGKYEIIGKVTWQTCNSYICLPPVTEHVVASIQIK